MRRILARRVSAVGTLVVFPIVFSLLTRAVLEFYKSNQIAVLVILPFIFIKYNISGILAYSLTTIILISLIIGIAYTIFEKNNGICGDFGINQKYFTSFSINLAIAFYASILTILIFPVYYLKFGVNSEYLILSNFVAPFFEELYFRLPMLVILSVRENKKLQFILFGRSDYDLDSLSWILILAFSLWFGIAHWLAGWTYGKIVQMFIFGILISLVALRLGIFGTFSFHLIFNSIAISLIYKLPFGFLVYITLLLWLLCLFMLLVEYIKNEVMKSACAKDCL